MKKQGVFLGAVLALFFTLGIGYLAECAVTRPWPSSAIPAAQTGGEIHFIRTEEDLYAMATGADFLGGHYVLDGDITLTRPWKPIGSHLRPFTGTFDGNGHVIYGLKAHGRNAGMFGYTRGAVIRNVVLERATLQGGAFFPIAALAEDTLIEECFINAPRARTPEGQHSLPDGAAAV